MSNPKGERNHPVSLLTRVIISGIVKQIVPIIALYIFLMNKLSETIVVGSVILYLVVINISLILSWKYTYFYIEENKLYFHKGIIHKVTRNIPLDKINTIDLSQNLLNQLFHLSRVKIDTESISDIGSEIILLLKTDRAKTLQEALLKKSVSQEGSIEKGNTYSVSPMELIRYSLLSNGLMETIFVLFALHEHISSIANLIGLNSDTYFDNILVTINRLLAFVGISLVMGFLIVLLRNIIRYTGFKVQIEPDTLQISYGLLEKKKYSLKRQKIKGIHIKQSLLMQWFHKYSIEVESIGYGDEGDEKAVLYPYCNEKLKKQIINELLPEIHHKNESIHGPPKKSLIHFIFFKVLAAIIAAFMIAFIIGLIWLGIPLIIAACAYGYMAYKNAAMGIENGLVYMSRGGFTKKQSYIYGHYIQSIGQSYNCFQKKRGICSYSVIIWGGLFKNIKVKHMENTLFESYVDYIN